MTQAPASVGVPEDRTRLSIVPRGAGPAEIDAVLTQLRRDQVVLMEGVSLDEADRLLAAVARELGLLEKLELQAEFAGFHGHRRRVSQYFMSVNERAPHQFIPPHSEGGSFSDMQLASFYCSENSTDGGTTVVLNVDDASPAWPHLRELASRAGPAAQQLTRWELARARALYSLNLPADLLRDDDRILTEHATEIAGLTVYTVLATPRRVPSRILERDSYAYWDKVAGADFDSASEFLRLLKEDGLLRQQGEALAIEQLDTVSDRRVWHSGVKYAELFRCKLTHRLRAGDLLLQNNVTWSHATSNWTPGSGVRQVAAAFA